MASPEPVEVVETWIGAREFFARYAGKRPVVIRSQPALRATHLWGSAYLRRVVGQELVNVKTGDVTKPRYVAMTYGAFLDEMEKRDRRPPCYLHNAPVLTWIPRLRLDLADFPRELLPRWYDDDWWRYSQYFHGPAGSATPLHFDSLGGHVTHFVVSGRKRFLFVERAHLASAYLKGFWSAVDAEAPDVERFPSFGAVPVLEAEVRAGDVVYWPPYTLHQVRNLTDALSFSIEWHTASDVLTNILRPPVPLKARDRRYNLFLALGLLLRLPHRCFYRFYWRYFDTSRPLDGVR